MTYIARTALPMFGLMVVAVLLVYFVPAIVTLLPQNMYGR
jgi:TRAP-type C4-dicarboxylate transport system permease large subunit